MGGSSDDTKEIALMYGATVIDNPQKIPAVAKRVGFSVARGRYVIMQDSDELLLSPTQLEQRLTFLKGIQMYTV